MAPAANPWSTRGHTFLQRERRPAFEILNISECKTAKRRETEAKEDAAVLERLTCRVQNGFRCCLRMLEISMMSCDDRFMSPGVRHGAQPNWHHWCPSNELRPKIDMGKQWKAMESMGSYGIREGLRCGVNAVVWSLCLCTPVASILPQGKKRQSGWSFTVVLAWVCWCRKCSNQTAALSSLATIANYNVSKGRFVCWKWMPGISRCFGPMINSPSAFWHFVLLALLMTLLPGLLTEEQSQQSNLQGHFAGRAKQSFDPWQN